MREEECKICEKSIENVYYGRGERNVRIAPYGVQICYDCIKIIGEVLSNFPDKCPNCSQYIVEDDYGTEPVKVIINEEEKTFHKSCLDEKLDEKEVN